MGQMEQNFRLADVDGDGILNREQLATYLKLHHAELVSKGMHERQCSPEWCDMNY